MRYFEKFLKLMLGGGGAALLLMMMARCGPWQMCNIALHTGVQSFVEFRIPSVCSIKIEYYYVIWLCAALLPASAFLLPAARRCASHLFGTAATGGFFSLCLLFFVLSFFSGFFLTEKPDQPAMPVCSVALYLTLGLSAVIFFFTGIFGHIAGFGLWDRLRSLVLTAKLPWFLAILFIAEFLGTNLISFFAFDHIPHIQDSFAQVFQGAIFAGGHLTAPSPPLKELFTYANIINNGQWYSQYPPGHSLLMMCGVLAGAPWIINPLLGSCTIVLVYFLGRELYSASVGRISALLAFFSPFILFMSSEFMNHATGLFLFTVFILFYARTVRSGSILPALIAGAALGWIVNIRPLTAATLALPFIVHACLLLIKRPRQYRLPFSAMSIPALLWMAVLLAYNYLTNGDPLLFGYQVLHGNEHLPGLGHAAWGEPLTLRLGIRHALNNFVGLNKYLFEWPIPSLIFVFILFASGRAGRWDRLLLGSFLCLALGYLFYWYQDWCFGPRFLYEASGCILLLTARGIVCTPQLVRKVFGQPIPVRRIYGFTTAVIFFCMAYGLTTNGPELYKLYSNSYWLVDAKIAREVERTGVKKAIVFTRNTIALMANSPYLDNGIIYVWDSEKHRGEMMSLYPGYRYFLGDKDRIVEIFP